jgi:hypothetical protein
MKRHKVKPEGPEVFRPDKSGDRAPYFEIRVGGKVLRARGDGAPLIGEMRRELTIDEYCGKPRAEGTAPNEGCYLDDVRGGTSGAEEAGS